MGRTRSLKKEFSLKDLENACLELAQTGRLEFDEYLGCGLYKMPGGIIVNEKTFNEIHKRISLELSK